MKSFFKKVYENPVFRGTLILSVANVFFHVFNYIFHLFMGRLLGPVQYGIFGSLAAIVSILAVFSSSVQVVSAKFTSMFKAKDDKAGIHNLFVGLTKWMAIFGFVIFLIILVLSPQIASFLNIPQITPVIIFAFIFLLIFLVPVLRGMLQGLQKFFYLSLSNSLEALFKLASGIILVILGFAVNGAVAAIILGLLLGYVVIFFAVRKFIFIKGNNQKFDWQVVKKYAVPVFFSYLGTTLLVTVDVVLVKHFFPAFDAGLYAALSVLGMIIFYITAPINTVMLPIIAEKFHRGEPYNKTFGQSLILYFLIGGVVTLLYFLIPQLIVKVFYGQAYLGVSRFLGPYAIYMILYNLSYIFMVYFLSIQKIKAAILPILASIFLAVAISLFHNSFAQVITSLIGVNFLLLISLILYFFFSKNNQIEVDSEAQSTI